MIWQSWLLNVVQLFQDFCRCHSLFAQHIQNFYRVPSAKAFNKLTWLFNFCSYICTSNLIFSILLYNKKNDKCQIESCQSHMQTMRNRVSRLTQKLGITEQTASNLILLSFFSLNTAFLHHFSHPKDAVSVILSSNINDSESHFPQLLTTYNPTQFAHMQTPIYV